MKVRNFCVIVDPVSTGAKYAPALSSFGIHCIAVRSPGYASDIAGLFQERDFYSVIQFSGDLEALAKELKDFGRISFVLAGSHYGLELADKLATRLDLAAVNDFSLSRVRHDKFELINWLNEKGIAAPGQLLSCDLKEIEQWVAESCPLPIVIKPRASAGTDSVTVCHDLRSLRAGFDRIVGKVDRYNNVNTHALVQSYLTGQEYAVDSVTYDGVHKFICMWKATRDKGEFPFAYVQEMVAADEENFPIIREYVSSILNACGYRYGAAHTEVILDATGQPKVIELNARAHGTLDQYLPLAGVGTNQVIEVARSYCGAPLPANWGDSPVRRGHSLKVTLVSTTEGTIGTDPRWDIFESLPSYCSSYKRIKRGGTLKKTRDMPSSPGVIFLHSPSYEKVWADYEKLRLLEKDFYAELLELDIAAA